MRSLPPLLMLAFATLFYFGLTDNARGPVYPNILSQFNLTSFAGSAFFALSSLSGLIITILAKYWLKYIDLKESFFYASLILALSSLCLALASEFNHVPLLYLSSVLIGIGMGFCSMSMNLVVEEEVAPAKRRQAFAGLHTTYGIASLLSPLFYASIISFDKPWNFYFYLLAIAGLVPVILIKFKKADVLYAKFHDHTQELEFNLPIPFLLTLSLSVGTYVASEIAVSSRLVYYLQTIHNYSEAQASNGLALFFLLLTGGRLSLALFSWKIASIKLMFISLMSTCLLGIIGVTYYPLALAFTGLSMSIFFPSLMDWLGSQFPKRFTQVTSFALTGVGAHLVFMHLGFGSLVDYLGLKTAMTLPIYLTVFSFLMLCLFKSWNQRLTKVSL